MTAPISILGEDRSSGCSYNSAVKNEISFQQGVSSCLAPLHWWGRNPPGPYGMWQTKRLSNHLPGFLGDLHFLYLVYCLSYMWNIQGYPFNVCTDIREMSVCTHWRSFYLFFVTNVATASSRWTGSPSYVLCNHQSEHCFWSITLDENQKRRLHCYTSSITQSLRMLQCSPAVHYSQVTVASHRSGLQRVSIPFLMGGKPFSKR